MPKLKNKKHELFCHEYLKDLNASASYNRVYKCKKIETAKVNASKLLTKTNVGQRIEELKARREKKIDVNADYVLQKYKDIVECDMTCLLDVYEEIENELVAFGKINDELPKDEKLPTPTFEKLFFGKYKKLPENIRKLLDIKQIQGKYGPTFSINIMSKDNAVNKLASHVNIGNTVNIEGEIGVQHKSLVDKILSSNESK